MEVESDHKPLESIFKKPLHTAPMRLQKMLLNLQKYSLTVKYVKGTNLHVADALSRNFVPECDYKKDLDIPICMINCVPMSGDRILELKAETIKDQELQTLKSTVRNGWPETKQDVQPNIRTYWSFRDEITVEDELIFRNNRIIIPKSLRKFMLGKIHQSHQGIEKSKNLARDVMYWPGMSAQIQETVEKCSTCNEFAMKNAKEPMMSHTKPGRPWQKVGTDLFEINGQQYFLIVDYYSSYFEINKLSSTSSRTVIDVCKEHFSRHGIPEEVISDNGPQYASATFHQFSQDWQFKHTLVSPRYPQSNGKAEKTVGIAKQLIKKANKENKDLHLALLDYRNTPISGIGKSPVQMLMSRRTNTTLPIKETLLKPEIVTGVTEKLEQQKEKQKKHYDVGSKDLLPLHKGESVLMLSLLIRVTTQDHM